MIGDQRTAMFIIISDTDDTFNFLVAIMYTQLFNLLCDRADDVHGGRLPHNVIPYIGMDEEMLALINRTLEKLWFLTDEAFLDLDLEPPGKQERCRMLLFFCVLNNGEFLCIIKP